MNILELGNKLLWLWPRIFFLVLEGNPDKDIEQIQNFTLISKQHANYVTSRSGGDRAVAEACLHILEKFFKPYDPLTLPNAQIKLSGEWAV